MTLLPNVPFTDGTIYTPEIAYLAFNQVFDDQTSYLGHRPKIVDTDLSDTSGQIKQRLSAVTEGLKCSVYSGLTVAHTSGSVRLPGGGVLTIAAGQIVVPDNTTSTIFVDDTGVLQVANIANVIRLPMATVTAVSGTITALIDIRDLGIRSIQPVAASIKSFGGTRSVDKTATNGEVFDEGFYYFRDFTVPSGVSITISRHAKIFCSGNVEISGTITVSTIANGAGGFGSVVAGSNLGGLSGTGLGGGSGSITPSPYPYSAQPYGSGGGLGFGSGTSGSVTIGNAGAGGGCLWIEAAGYINITGTILANGNPATTGSATGSNAIATGSGGGSGGLIYLSSLAKVTCTGTSNLSVAGGNGGNAARSGSSIQSNGGGGGAGGWVVLASPLNNTTGSTINLSGGAAGTTITGTGGIGGGTGGAFGGTGGASSGSGNTGRFLSLTFVPLGG